MLTKMIFFMMSFYLFIMSLVNWILFIFFLINKICLMINWEMLNLNSFKIIYYIYIDWMTLIFVSTVLLISSMVILYSQSYMNHDYFIKRFMFLIIIFVMSMIFMILSPNMFSILLGWDGLGLSSYCLVAYYQSKKSFNCSMVTILMNRVGDIMILLLMGFLMMKGSWNFLFFLNLNFYILFFMMMASITKSAQIPFSSWLPMAMAAPTPISSLVHSSTLVTAGIYLMIRFNYLMTKDFMYMIMFVSCLTMFMAGLSANFEFDLKKIIALSTLSQLGLMIMIISINYMKLAFFHLITHAMFKSLLFLCSGIIIHNYSNNQDIRFISLMNFNLPLINLILNISSLCLCGLPFLSGFYSKDLIIEMFLMNKNNLIMMIMMFMSMGFTMAYTFRLIFYISIKSLKINLFIFFNLKNLMNYSILILLFMTIFYGSILNWLIFSSLNLIYLPKKLKLFIYLILFFSMIISLILCVINKIFYKKKIYFFLVMINFLLFFNLIFKKNKLNLLKFNNKMIFLNDYFWLEYLTFKKILFMFINFKNYKFLYNFNYLLMIFLVMNLIFLNLYN